MTSQVHNFVNRFQVLMTSLQAFLAYHGQHYYYYYYFHLYT